MFLFKLMLLKTNTNAKACCMQFLCNHSVCLLDLCSSKCNAKFIWTLSLFVPEICAIVQWNTRKCCLCFIIHAIFVFFPLPQFLLSFYFFAFYKIAKKNKKSFIFMATFEDFNPHHKTQPSRLTVGQLEIPKKVQVNFPNWFQNNIVYIIESNTFQKP